MRAKTSSIEGVEAHRHSLQAVGVQIDGVLREQHAVGRQRDVLDARDIGQIADQIGQVRAQQRLAAGEAQLAHAEPANSRVRRTISSNDRRSCDFRKR